MGRISTLKKCAQDDFKRLHRLSDSCLSILNSVCWGFVRLYMITFISPTLSWQELLLRNHSLENVPLGARRDYFIYLLDYGWHEPISQALRENFDNMAQRASKTKAVIIRGTELGDFQNEVLSWHHINNEDTAELLPALLITNAHPAYFRGSIHRFSGRKNILRVDDEYANMKMILIPFKRFCKSTTEVISLIEKVFNDISKEKGLANFQIAKEMKKGLGHALVDAVVLQPNIYGMGFNLKKIVEYLGK